MNRVGSKTVLYPSAVLTSGLQASLDSTQNPIGKVNSTGGRSNQQSIYEYVHAYQRIIDGGDQAPKQSTFFDKPSFQMRVSPQLVSQFEGVRQQSNYRPRPEGNLLTGGTTQPLSNEPQVVEGTRTQSRKSTLPDRVLPPRILA